jgi:hypothetical protein
MRSRFLVFLGIRVGPQHEAMLIGLVPVIAHVEVDDTIPSSLIPGFELVMDHESRALGKKIDASLGIGANNVLNEQIFLLDLLY